MNNEQGNIRVSLLLPKIAQVFVVLFGLSVCCAVNAVTYTFDTLPSYVTNGNFTFEVSSTNNYFNGASTYSANLPPAGSNVPKYSTKDLSLNTGIHFFEAILSGTARGSNGGARLYFPFIL